MERKSSRTLTRNSREAEEAFKQEFEKTFKLANPHKFKPEKDEDGALMFLSALEVEQAKFEDYNPARAKEPMYRYHWRQKFLKAGRTLPPELKVLPSGRHTQKSGMDRIESVRRCRARKKLAAAGLPIPPELQKRSTANRGKNKVSS